MCARARFGAIGEESNEKAEVEKRGWTLFNSLRNQGFFVVFFVDCVKARAGSTEAQSCAANSFALEV